MLLSAADSLGAAVALMEELSGLAGLDEAFAIADRLSKPFDFVRVDLYLTPHGVRFGELTFTPAAALDNKRLPETDLRFGRRMEETL